jgi:hypothetical protein
MYHDLTSASARAAGFGCMKNAIGCKSSMRYRSRWHHGSKYRPKQTAEAQARYRESPQKRKQEIERLPVIRKKNNHKEHTRNETHQADGAFAFNKLVFAKKREIVIENGNDIITVAKEAIDRARNFCVVHFECLVCGWTGNCYQYLGLRGRHFIVRYLVTGHRHHGCNK